MKHGLENRRIMKIGALLMKLYVINEQWRTDDVPGKERVKAILSAIRPCVQVLLWSWCSSHTLRGVWTGVPAITFRLAGVWVFHQHQPYTVRHSVPDDMYNCCEIWWCSRHTTYSVRPGILVIKEYETWWRWRYGWLVYGLLMEDAEEHYDSFM